MRKFVLWTLGIFLTVVFGSFLVVAVFGQAIMGWALRPAVDFDPAHVPAPPEYAEAAAWAALPDREDLADLVPADDSKGDRQATAKADVFFVHPTTYYASDRWNGPIDDPRAEEMTAITIASQASAFNHCCRVFAPRYRQAAIGAYLEADESSLQAFRLAYADVKAAFDYYLEHNNQGRPFIIAAHSQGTMHAARLLEELEEELVREQLVAAYLVGYRLPVSVLKERLPRVPICEGPEATGCLVGWDTHTEEGDPKFEIPYIHWQGDSLETTQGVSRLCVNPLTWKVDEQLAEAEQHLGAVTVQTAEPFPGMLSMMFADEAAGMEVTGLGAPRPKSHGARCVGDRLNVPTLPEPYVTMNEGGSYHIYDYDLFYEDVRVNARQRVEAFLAAAQPEPDTAP